MMVLPGDTVDIGPEAFTNGEVICYKGDNYYKACDTIVTTTRDGQTFCVKRVGHPGVLHEDYEGNVRGSGKGYSYVNEKPIEENTTIADIASPDAPAETTEHGGKHSLIEVRFDQIDAKALFEMAHILYVGGKKYGDNNWRSIDVPDHLNHLIMHAYAYLSGDETDEHLSHMMCRAMFAQAVQIQGGPLSHD